MAEGSASARPGARRAGPPGQRPVWAEIDLEAVRHNCRLMARLVAPARLCAVVKADGYGHGAPAVAAAAVEAGASWLAVAMVEEGAALRRAGIEAPVLLLSEPPAGAMGEVLELGLTPTLYSRSGVRALAEAASAARRVADVHVKVDTGMHRVGADPADVPEIAGAVVAADHLRLAGLWTHLAVADGTAEEDRAFTAAQLERFAAVRRALAGAGVAAPLHHAANSAGALCYPQARLDMVRCGITVYGLPPAPELAHLAEGLRPVLSLHARVSFVRTLEAGERPSYGRRYPLPETSVVATVPLGYADGVPWRYFEAGGTVLLGGRRRPLAGSVTMDQVMVDCGADAVVAVGDEVVLIGSQGSESLSAWDWARTLGTIAYEVVCGIGPRVPRVAVDGGGPALVSGVPVGRAGARAPAGGAGQTGERATGPPR
jgi:alanine racemase